MATCSYPKSTLSAGFSPIPPAPVRVGEDELPPSWDPVPSPKVMVSKGSPKFRGSPKLRRLVAAASAIKKKPSPKSCGAKKIVGSPRAVQNQRASWNPALEKSLVDILLEYKDTSFRGDNGCQNSEGWNRMVQELHHRNRQMVEGSPSMWDKLVVSHHKIKKFHNNKATFPLFDDLGELYDGHLAEGNHNFVSLVSPRAEDLKVKLEVKEMDNKKKMRKRILQQMKEVESEEELLLHQGMKKGKKSDQERVLT
ncbi:hypothetical protein QOZ80_8BG0648650 [Eleusine coracana subsp. coracana]|nr:hypothetical protein QOZ80_8BG0648650 [Eleusine coracana subsp. coracana]